MRRVANLLHKNMVQLKKKKNKEICEKEICEL